MWPPPKPRRRRAGVCRARPWPAGGVPEHTTALLPIPFFLAYHRLRVYYCVFFLPVFPRAWPLPRRGASQRPRWCRPRRRTAGGEAGRGQERRPAGGLCGVRHHLHSARCSPCVFAPSLLSCLHQLPPPCLSLLLHFCLPSRTFFLLVSLSLSSRVSARTSPRSRCRDKRHRSGYSAPLPRTCRSHAWCAQQQLGSSGCGGSAAADALSDGGRGGGGRRARRRASRSGTGDADWGAAATAATWGGGGDELGSGLGRLSSATAAARVGSTPRWQPRPPLWRISVVPSFRGDPRVGCRTRPVHPGSSGRVWQARRRLAGGTCGGRCHCQSAGGGLATSSCLLPVVDDGG